MPPKGHKTVTVTSETLQLIGKFQDSLPVHVSQGEVVRAAMLVLANQVEPLEAIRVAKESRF